MLRHLAVHPSAWGAGLGRRLVAACRPAPTSLWCLAANTQALGFYTALGWQPTGVERDAERPPYPREIELTR